jgi:transposase
LYSAKAQTRARNSGTHEPAQPHVTYINRLEMNMIPVVPPKSNRREPWEYDRELYKKRNQIERLFRRLKGFRRIFSRFSGLHLLCLHHRGTASVGLIANRINYNGQQNQVAIQAIGRAPLEHAEII